MYFIDGNNPGVVYKGTSEDMMRVKGNGGNPAFLTRDEDPYILWDDGEGEEYYWDVIDVASGEYLQKSRRRPVPETLDGNEWLDRIRNCDAEE